MGLFAARDRWGVGGYYVPRQAAGKIRSYTGKGGKDGKDDCSCWWFKVSNRAVLRAFVARHKVVALSRGVLQHCTVQCNIVILQDSTAQNNQASLSTA